MESCGADLVNKQRPLVVTDRVYAGIRSAQGWHRNKMDKETRNMALFERPTEILLSSAAGSNARQGQWSCIQNPRPS